MNLQHLQCQYHDDSGICNKLAIYKTLIIGNEKRCEDHKGYHYVPIISNEFVSLYTTCEHHEIILDWLKEKGYNEEVTFLEQYNSIPEQLKSLDWANAFNFRPELVETALPNDIDCSVKMFYLWDVDEIYHLHEGQNDGDDWLIVGSLKDKRFFYIAAGCCYTGWGVMAHHRPVVSEDYNELLQYGIPEYIRNDFGIKFD